MSNKAKTDRQKWRDEFERTGENPVAWQLTARAHLAAANLLLERLNSSAGESNEDDSLGLWTMPIHLLLGYALENLVKGLLVARGETATWDGSLDDDRSSALDKGMKHHCLAELFRVAEVKTNAREKQLL